MPMQVLAEVAPPDFGMFPVVLGSGLVVFWTVFWIWMLIDCARNTALDETVKVVWLLVVLFLQSVGAFIYSSSAATRHHLPREIEVRIAPPSLAEQPAAHAARGAIAG